MKKEDLKGTVFEPYSPQVKAYKIVEADKECKYLGMSENAFVDFLRIRQKHNSVFSKQDVRALGCQLQEKNKEIGVAPINFLL